MEGDSVTCACRRVVWVSSSHSELSFAMRYPQIIMHAVSRDTSSFPKPCIYIQLDDGEYMAICVSCINFGLHGLRLNSSIGRVGCIMQAATHVLLRSCYMQN